MDFLLTSNILYRRWGLRATQGGMSEVQVQTLGRGCFPGQLSYAFLLSRKLFCAADVNQNGTVELDEFIDFVMHGKQRIAKIMQELMAFGLTGRRLSTKGSRRAPGPSNQTIQ